MHGEIVQTYSGFSAALEAFIEGEPYASAEITNNITFGGACNIMRNGKLLYTLSYDTEERASSIGKSKQNKNLIPYKIDDANGNKCGQIGIKQADVPFWRLYSFHEMTINSNTYRMYTVGLGKEGLKYPIYCNDTQIALMGKDAVVVNNLDKYDIYAHDRQGAEIAVLFGLYIDITAAANRGTAVTESVRKVYSITTNKELKSKYNPDFKQSCML